MMFKPLSAASAVVALFAFVHPALAGSQATADQPQSTVTKKCDDRTPAKPAVRLSENEDRLVKAVNAYRAKRGLEPLTVDPVLMNVGRNAAPYFSHQINGKWCWTRAHEAGFPGWASDDIANGYESPEDAVDGWASSDGHAHQMRGHFNMNGQWRDYKFNRIGVGISGRKYIAVFGRSDDKL
jgi:uncharacterized protein YkwD